MPERPIIWNGIDSADYNTVSLEDSYTLEMFWRASLEQNPQAAKAELTRHTALEHMLHIKLRIHKVTDRDAKQKSTLYR